MRMSAFTGTFDDLVPSPCRDCLSEMSPPRRPAQDGQEDDVCMPSDEEEDLSAAAEDRDDDFCMSSDREDVSVAEDEEGDIVLPSDDGSLVSASDLNNCSHEELLTHYDDHDDDNDDEDWSKSISEFSEGVGVNRLRDSAISSIAEWVSAGMPEALDDQRSDTPTEQSSPSSPDGNETW